MRDSSKIIIGKNRETVRDGEECTGQDSTYKVSANSKRLDYKATFIKRQT